ncbi:unnamed protein product [Echinostoma caproni]|uniref:AZUL domain-containing protein n=1 Tax=Echinostoma caproni TaxID=27848 RepID=A0A183ABC8_9TREM|nr:unnamed protein product [Echinostoma caproni]
MLRIDPNSRVQQLIIRYFNQLRLGCSNPNCPNPNCASSPSFAHPNLNANQAAVLAMQLTADRAPLCYPPDNPTTATTTTTTSNPTTSTAEDCVMAGTEETDQTLSRSTSPNDEVTVSTVPAPVSTPSSETSFTSSASARTVSLGASITAAEDSSHSSLMTPREVTRLLMLLFDATDNDDVGSSPGGEEHSAGESQSGHTSRAIAGSSGRSSIRGKNISISMLFLCLTHFHLLKYRLLKPIAFLKSIVKRIVKTKNYQWIFLPHLESGLFS